MAEKHSRVLIVAYYFPPMGTVGFLRNYHFTKCFSEICEDVYVITIRNISLKLNDNLKLETFNVHRICNYDYRNLMSFFSHKKNDVRKNINSGSSSGFVKFFRKIIDSFPFNILIGEGGLLYIFNGTIKGIQLIRKYRITHLYTSYRPIADHIIAFNLKLFFPKLKWIADFRDLPVDEFRQNTFFPWLQKLFIKKLITKAKNVITVSNGLNESMKLLRYDSISIRNGIYKMYDISKTNKNSIFTISYTGSLYPEFQRPSLFFKAIRNLLKYNIFFSNEICIQYAGKDSEVWNREVNEFKLNSISVDLGELSLFESIKTQVNSDLLLFFSWSDENHKGILTGKLFEYLVSGNPIFAIINGVKDNEIEEILDDYTDGMVFYNDNLEKLESEILNRFSKWKNNEIAIINNVPSEYIDSSWQRVKEDLRKLI